MIQIETQRLILRAFREDDFCPFSAINSDARVMDYLGEPLSRKESDALILRLTHGLREQGFGVWAVERKDVSGRPFIGFVGLSAVSFQAEFTPCVEIAWRLSSNHWNLGLATEGARAVLKEAFTTFQLAEVVSFTVRENLASRRVMEKIGMSRDPKEDFEHPKLPPGHRLRAHVLYRMSRECWEVSGQD
jgi:RimJ/RimL family protein N-acetyltransferase